MRIVIAHRHAVFIEGIKSMLAGEVDLILVGEAVNSNELIAFLKLKKVDVLLLDAQFIAGDMAEILAVAHKLQQHIRIIIITHQATKEDLYELPVESVHGFLEMNVNKSELLSAIKTVYEGVHYYSPRIISLGLEMINTKLPDKPAPNSLDIQILQFIANGLSTREIAKKLHLSIDTIKSHRKKLMEILEAKNSSELVKIALRREWIHYFFHGGFIHSISFLTG